jgi:hypothetical protein
MLNAKSGARFRHGFLPLRLAAARVPHPVEQCHRGTRMEPRRCSTASIASRHAGTQVVGGLMARQSGISLPVMLIVGLPGGPQVMRRPVIA